MTGLTGTATLLLAVVLAVGTFAALLVLWPRAPGVRSLLVRGGLLGVQNVVVLLAAALLFNDHYGFYASWTDLGRGLGIVAAPQLGVSTTAGGDPRAAVENRAGTGTAGGGTGAVAAGLSGPADPPFPSDAPLPVWRAKPSPGRRVVYVTVTGPRSGIRSTIAVALPPGYDDAANRTRRYPVIETFPGYPGTPFNPSRTLDTLAEQHVVGPVILLEPTAEIPTGIDTECVDGGALGQPVETFLTRDVPDWAVQHLRVALDRTGWATAGLSAGGWCAAMAAMLHPARYSAAIVMGGYFKPEFSPAYVPFTATSPQGARYDLVALAAKQPPPIAMWLQTSPADQISYATSEALLSVARAPMAVRSLVLTDAGHRLSTWLPLLPQAFAWLASTDPAFTPKRIAGG